MILGRFKGAIGPKGTLGSSAKYPRNGVNPHTFRGGGGRMGPLVFIVSHSCRKRRIVTKPTYSSFKEFHVFPENLVNLAQK